MTTNIDSYGSARQRHWQNHSLLDLGQSREQNCWARKAVCPIYDSEIANIISSLVNTYWLCYGVTYTGAKSRFINRHETMLNNLDIKCHMKSTQRKKVTEHSISADISFPVVVTMKRNLPSSPKYIWGLQCYKPTLRMLRQFQNTEQGNAVDNLSFRTSLSERNNNNNLLIVQK